MIAIPVKRNETETAIAPLFGKAKWFALVNEDKEVTFWKNESHSGRVVSDYLISQNVDAVILQHIGHQPFEMLESAGIQCFDAGEGRVLYKDALALLSQETLEKVTEYNIDCLAAHGHSHGHNHEDHHHHH